MKNLLKCFIYPSIYLLIHLFPADYHLEKIENEIIVSGSIVDENSGEAIPFATIQVLNEEGQIDGSIGIVTNLDGYFYLSFNGNIPTSLLITHIAYEQKNITLTKSITQDIVIKLVPAVAMGEEIVVLSSIINLDQLKETNTIERISATQIQQVAAYDLFDIMSSLRGVDIATQSMNLQTISTRGFNTGANSRFLQLTDGVDSQAPGLGFPVGNLLGLSELDIESIELMSGPASSRFGPGAMSGALITQSKDPFTNRGLSVNIKGGVNGLKLGGANSWSAEGDGLYDISGRFALVLHENLAFKFTGSWTEGTDWRADNYDNIGFGEFWESRNINPGFNGVNIYGDENFVYMPVGVDKNNNPNNSLVPVTRTGYKEADLVDYDISTRKASGSLHYRYQNVDFNIGGRYGYTNTLYTADSRIRLQDFRIYQFNSELRVDDFYIRGYSTWQNSGNSYDVYHLANKLLNRAKSDVDWFRDFRMIYENGFSLFNIPPGNIQRARAFADGPLTLRHNHEAEARYEVGTELFQNQVEQIKSTYDFDQGAGIRDNSSSYHVDSGYKFNNLSEWVEFETGISFRFYDIDSGGTIFPDTTNNNITNYQYGGFLGAQSFLFDESLNLNLTLRYDKNENFKGSISPQFSIGYVLNDNNFFRLSYQYGFRFPTVREQFMNQNIGTARILGGLSEITKTYELQKNSVTTQSLDQYNEAILNDISPNPLINPSPLNRKQAEINNLQKIEMGIIGDKDLRNIRSEKTHAFEVGYRRLITPSLYVDFNYYVNFYEDFIGFLRLVKPRTSPLDDLYTAAGQVNNTNESDRYFVFTNAKDRVTIHGFSFDTKYQSGGFFAGLNGTYTKLLTENEDPITPGFNTPPLKLNAEWGNRAIAPNVGFKMMFKYRMSHNWQSPFLDGKINSYGHFDFQLNVRIPKIGSMIKAGLTNLGINDYYNVYGGPKIGSIIFATFTYDPRSI